MSVYSKFVDHIKDRLNIKTIASEMASTVTDRIIPHGAAELAHAFMTQGSGYVPYGQESIPVSDADAVQDAPPSMAEQYQASLAMNAKTYSHDVPDQSQAPDL